MLLRDDEKSRKKMFNFLIRHLIIGVVTGWVILSVFIILDIANLRSLAIATGAGAIVFPLLYAFFAITFGSAAMGIGIMGINDDDDNDNDGHHINILPTFHQLSPVKVHTKKR